MYNELKQIISENSQILVNEPMKKHTTFKIGGNADFLVVIEKMEDLIKIREYATKNNIPLFILGNGSNLIVNDNGIRGIVVKVETQNVECRDNLLIADAGVSFTKLSHVAHENSLTGMEWACGIPGSVGGAIYMNAGAYGGEVSDIVKYVEYIDENGEIKRLNRDELNFSYRKSAFNTNKANGIIIRGCFELEKGDKDSIMASMNDYLKRRRDKQPIEMPSAGSVFKRPEGHFVGQMIEELGLKGYRIGGAEVSNKHAGFIVNAGDATAQDVKNLIDFIKVKVKERYNIELETEVKFV